MVLGRVNISQLNAFDILIRTTVRKWFDLPEDTPNAYFHADFKDVGLSIPSMRWVIPLQRLHRLKKLTVVQ